MTAGSETGRRPSVTIFDGKLSVDYEWDSTSPGMAQDIVVATLQPASRMERAAPGLSVVLIIGVPRFSAASLAGRWQVPNGP